MTDERKEERGKVQRLLGEYVSSLIENELFPLSAMPELLITAVADMLKDLASVVLDRDAWDDDELHDWCMDRAYYLCKWDSEEDKNE